MYKTCYVWHIFFHKSSAIREWFPLMLLSLSKTFKIWVRCLQTKLFQLNSLLYVHFCVPLFAAWRYNNNLFIRYSYHTTIRSSYTSALISTLFSRSLQRRSSNHECFLHTQVVFPQDWLNYYSSCALSCPFIDQHKYSNERSWSRMFVFSQC